MFLIVLAFRANVVSVDANEFNKLMKQVFRFRSIANARAFADGATKLHMILMGDCDDDGWWFWIAVPAVTERLQRAGYEYLR